MSKLSFQYREQAKKVKAALDRDRRTSVTHVGGDVYLFKQGGFQIPCLGLDRVPHLKAEARHTLRIDVREAKLKRLTELGLQAQLHEKRVYSEQERNVQRAREKTWQQ